MSEGATTFAKILNITKFLQTLNCHNFVKCGWILEIQNLRETKKIVEPTTMNFNDVNTYAHALKLKIFFLENWLYLII